MTSDVPWRFRGLRPEVRDAAIQAARRAGVPVGEWLNDIIIDSAAEEGVYPEPQPPAQTADNQTDEQKAHDDLTAIRTRLEELSRQLDRLSQPAQTAETAGADAPQPAASPAAAAAAPTVADGTTAHASAQPAKPTEPVQSEPAARPQTTADKPDDYAMRLDQAVAEIRSRRHALDSEPIQPPAAAPSAAAGAGAGAQPEMGSALEQQLRLINQRIDTLRQPCGAADVVAAMRGDLAEIAGLLKSALPQRAIELLEAEVRNLNQRIEEQRGNGGSAAAIANLERGLDELRQTLTTLKPAESLGELEASVKELSRRIEAAGAPVTDVAALSQFDASIASLRSAIGNVASSDVVSRLADDMRALSDKVDAVATSAGGGADLLSSLEKRISAMADTLEKHNSQCAKGLPHLEDVLTLLVERLEQTPAPSDPQALNQIETRLAGVTDRLDVLKPANVDIDALRQIEERVTAIAARLDPQALQQIENRIATLTDRLDQPPPAQEPMALRQIEGRIETLFDKLDEISRTSQDPAALRDLEQHITAIAGKLDASDARFAHLEAIEQGLAGVLAHVEDLRAGQAESLMRAAMPAGDRQGVDDIKRELHEIKDTERRTQTSIEAVHGTLGHVVDRLAMIENDLRWRPAETATTAPTAPSPPSAPVRQSSDTDPAPALPREPAAAAPGPQPSATDKAAESATSAPAATPAASPAAPPASDPSARLNFIAAARRAAQAAAAETPRPTSRTQTGRDQDGGLGSPAKGKASPTRSIVVGIGALVILLGATHVVWNFVAAPEGPASASVPAAAPIDHTGRNAVTSAASTPTPDDVPEPAAPAEAAPGAASAPNDEHTGTPGPGKSRQAAVATSAPTTIVTSSPAAAPVAAPLAAPIIPEAVPVADAQPIPLPPTAPGTAAANNQAASAIPPAEPLQAAPVAAAIARDAPDTSDTSSVTPANITVPDRQADPDALPAAIGSAKLRAAAIMGDATAQFEIANRFAEGRSVTQNVAEAARWFERAADQGLVPAQFQIASLYEKGRGVKKDLSAARRHYAAAAKGGNAKAMHNLAVLYAEGLAGKSDYATAAMWFRMAANRGVTDSQYNLGILYARGIGVDLNLAESYKWFALAAKQGDKDAESKRDDVSARLDEPSQIAAERAVDTFVPEPQPEAATKVSGPAGGWDKSEAGASAAKGQGDKSGAERAKRNKRSSKS